MTDVVSRTIQVRNEHIHMLEGGDGEPLLLLHPAGGAGVWRAYHALLARSHRVIAPDHPGFGRSPLSEGIDSVTDIAFLYADLLDALNIKRATVVGMSFGGWIAAELAVLDPHRIERLVLINAIGLRIAGAPIADLFAMSPQEKIAALFHDPSVAADLFPSQPTLDDLMDFYRSDTAFARYAWEPFCCNPKLADRLYRITAPTLVLQAEQDRLVPAAHADMLSERIPDARLQRLPDIGHAALLERPEITVGAIQHFLSA